MKTAIAAPDRPHGLWHRMARAMRELPWRFAGLLRDAMEDDPWDDEAPLDR